MKAMQKVLMVGLFAYSAANASLVQADNTVRLNNIPTTISEEAQASLAAIYSAKAYTRTFPEAEDYAGWKKTHADAEEDKFAANQTAVKENRVTIKQDKLGGVPVVDIKPIGWTDNGKIIVYTHGGAYTMFSANSTLTSSAPMSRVTGLRVISIDYTLAPFAKWEEQQHQIVKVFEALLEQGYSMNDIAMYGDSAGGGLAASTVLNLRDQGLGMPAAVALLSPWVDISDKGDTQTTLTYTDPLLQYDTLLETSATAYAGGLELTDARVSALYADFSKGFSPTIITEGTKCMFLSTSVRLYQALDQANQEVKLDVYEGMWHVFQVTPMPETDISLNKIKTFFYKHLSLEL